MNPAQPLLATALADDLANNRAAEGERPTADNTLLRGSDAYSCARRIAFGALRIPKVVPYTPSTLMAFDAGDHVHKRLQGILARDFAAELEVPVSYREHGIDLSGHADAAYAHEGHQRVVEIKSMKSYPYLKAAGSIDRYGRPVEPEGPKLEHVLQAGIYGNAPQLQADELHMIYVAKEDGQIAEWILPMKGEPFGPDGQDIADLVAAELARLKQIELHIREGRLPWRHVPGFGVVKDPPAADSKDDPWNCRYCPWQPTCVALPASPVPVAAVTDPIPDEEPF